MSVADLLEGMRPLPETRITVEGSPAADGVPVITGPAVYANLSREAYDQMKGWNASLIKKVLDRTLGHAWYEFIRPDREPQADQEAFVKGNQLHTLKLEPELYDERYVVEPATLPNRPTAKQLQEPTAKPGTKTHDAWQDAKAREAAWVEWEATVPAGAKVVPASWHEEASAWNAAIDRHRVLGPMFGPEHRHLNELTLTWLDPITKAPCKGRLDALRIFDDHIWIGDLKTALAAGGAFERSAANLWYPVAATFYADAVFHCRGQLEAYLGLPDGALIGREVRFEWIAIEKVAPHFIERLLLENEQVEVSRRLIRRALDAIVAAERANWWPAYPEEARPLQVPGYWIQNAQRVCDRLEGLLEGSR
jgi:hypothetical protein